MWCKISLSCLQLSNSGDILKLLIPNYNRKIISGWGYKLLGNTMNIIILLSIVFFNYSWKVISQMMIERKIDNRGSKSIVSSITLVKEQRANGSWQVKYYNTVPSKCLVCLRYALMGFEINFQIRTFSTNKNILIRFSSSKVKESCIDLSLVPFQQNFNINLMNFFKTLFQIRLYSIRSSQSFGHKSLVVRTAAIKPWFVTGFTDAEGCFHVSITKNNKLNVGCKVQLFFEISLKENDYAILKQIKNLFCVGSINYNKKTKSFLFRVSSSKDLKIIIDHFDKFPLITQKRADFELFKKVFNLMLRNQHLTMEGLRIIVAIKGSMNKGQLSDMLKINFPDIVPVVRPIVKNKKIKNPHWLAGFTAGEGCFFIEVSKSNTHIIGFQVKLLFVLTQHSRDEQLLKSFIIYLECGRLEKVKSRPDIVEFIVTKLDDISQKIIPFFQKHKIQGVKYKDFDDWCKVAEMMKDKKHLTKEGLEQIRKIKSRMNTGRKFY